MKKPLILALLLLSSSAFSQKKANQAESSLQNDAVIPVPMKADNWEFKPETVEFLEYKSRPAMKLLTSKDQVILKDLNFTNGTIEYDMEPLDPRFTSLYFRWNGLEESESYKILFQRVHEPYYCLFCHTVKRKHTSKGMLSATQENTCHTPVPISAESNPARVSIASNTGTFQM